MNGKMNLVDLLLLFKRRFWWMLFMTLCFASLIAVISLFVVKPTYEYSTQVLVGYSGDTESASFTNKVDENKQLAISITDMIHSPQIMTGVIEQLDLAQSSYDLLENVSVRNRENSQVITITVKNSDAALTKEIALATATQAIAHFKEYATNQQIHILGGSESRQEANLLFPKPIFVIALSLVLGIFAGVGLTFLREQFDDKIYQSQTLKHQAGVLVLGKVTLKVKRKRKKRSYDKLPVKNRGEQIEV